MLKEKHFKYSNDLVAFVNNGQELDIVAITSGDRFSEGLFLFYNENKTENKQLTKYKALVQKYDELVQGLLLKVLSEANTMELLIDINELKKQLKTEK